LYSYKDQLDVIGKLKLRDGNTFRGNCPFCGGKNTFTVSKIHGKTVWNCYRAGCSISGTKDGLPSMSSIMDTLKNEKREAQFPPIPQVLVSPLPRGEIVEWLSVNHCMEALYKGLIEIKYSSIEDRVMFPVKYEGRVVGYSGRAIPVVDVDKDGIHGITQIHPKWRKYGDTTHILTCGVGEIGVIVEDACSACAVGIDPKFTGISLLGTNLTDVHKQDLLRFKRLVVCLDPDASKKGMDMAWNLAGIVPTVFRQIPNDLKYYDINQINKILHYE
jgi:hypothetical protein